MDTSGDYAGSGTHLSGYLSYGVDGWFLKVVPHYPAHH